MKRYFRFDWDALAGILAAVAALVMHFLHIIQADILLAIAVVLIALLFIRDLRRERVFEAIQQSIAESGSKIAQILTGLRPPDAVLVGPRDIRSVSEDFSRRARGDMVWFHVCLLMFRPQSLFDSLLRPAIENPLVKSIQFVLDKAQQELWHKDVLPKINACAGSEKVREPRWTTIRESVSLIISDVGPRATTECLLSFWGEPFMAHSTDKDVPRYIFHIQGHSELVVRLVELERAYRLGTSGA